MLTRRIIPCLDVKDGRVVKGIQFRGLRDVGDPVELAAAYARTGADELCFLDVAASVENRPLTERLVREVSREVFVPFTVGGGVRSVEDGRALLRAGADKVALNTAALKRPELLTELASEFGSQCVVLSLDTASREGTWYVTSYSATSLHERTALEWAEEATSAGAGEILLNAVDTDGARAGFSIEITRTIAEAVTVPVIASGGAGEPDHFVEVFKETEATAALAASVFHDGSHTPDGLKEHLWRRGIEVRR